MHQELIVEALHHAERFHHDRPAVVHENQTTTYGEFAERCRRLAGTLAAHGVRKGDRVAALLLNRSEYLELYFAVPGLGATLVPLNLRHAPAELRYILDDCEPRLVLVEPALQPLADQLDGVPQLDVTGLDISEQEPIPLGRNTAEDDIAGLFYTGGTTGHSKGVMLSHRNLVSNAHHTNFAFGYRASDVYLHSAPMFHLADGASTYALTWVGGTHAFVSRFDPGEVLETIERQRVTCALFVPTMLTAILAAPDFETRDTSTVRMVLHGGAPLSGDLLARCIDSFPGGCTFTEAFGMTEAAPVLTYLSGEERLAGDPAQASVGKSPPGVMVDVRTPDGESCASGEVGEVVAAGPNIMVGYLNKPDATAEVLRDGEYWTGDLGYFDEQSNLHIVDRAKDMVISGGENVYSAEVENALANHPSVLEVGVFGVPDDKWGERVHAAVVLVPGADTTEDELVETCREAIAAYKLPRSFEFHDELPKSGAGKILKRQLREPHWVGSARQVG